MKRYISLAGAILIGTVVAKDTKKEKTLAVSALEKAEAPAQVVAAAQELKATMVEYVSDYTSNVDVQNSIESADNDVDVRRAAADTPDTSVNVRVNSVTTAEEDVRAEADDDAEDDANDGADAEDDDNGNENANDANDDAEDEGDDDGDDDDDSVDVRTELTYNTYNTPDVRVDITTVNDDVTSEGTEVEVEAYTSAETSARPETTPEVMDDADTTPEEDGVDSVDTSVDVESAWTENTANTWGVKDRFETASFHSVERHISPITDNTQNTFGVRADVTSCDEEEEETSPVVVQFRRRDDYDDDYDVTPDVRDYDWDDEFTPDVREVSDNNSAWDFNYDVKVRDFYDDDDVYDNDYDIKARDYYDDLDDLPSHGFKGVCGRRYDVPVGETFWCDDRQEGLRTNCVVTDKYKYMCCVSKYGCDDERDFKTWRF